MASSLTAGAAPAYSMPKLPPLLTAPRPPRWSHASQAVLSADTARCERVAAAFQAGIVWVNCSQPCFAQSPWGGFKRSGIGRELGEWGLDNYLEVKSVMTYVSPNPLGWYTMPQSKL